MKSKEQKTNWTHNPTGSPPVLLAEVTVALLTDDLTAAVAAFDSIRSRTHRLYDAAEITATHGAFVTTLQTNLTAARTKARGLKMEFDLRSKATSLIKREALPLPRFGGESSSWAEFKDQFEAAFHKDGNLSPSVKLQNLKNLMVPGSPPAQLISGFSITDTNYPLAYKALNDRYEKTRELVFTYIDAILDTPTLNNQGGLQNLIDTINTSVQKIQSLGIPTGEWGPIIARLIYRKLDQSSRREIEKAHSGNNVPALVDIMKTLEPLAAAYESTRSKTSPSSSNEKDKSKIPQKSKNKSEPPNENSSDPSSSKSKDSKEKRCNLCSSADHWTSGCDQLTRLNTINQRTKLLRDRKLCEICLNAHASSSCKRKAPCSTKDCREIHNFALCPLKLSQSTSTPTTSSCSTTTRSNEILPTVVIELLDHEGNPIKFRGLVDSCSQINVISERAMSILKTPRAKADVIVTGTGSVNCGSPKGSSIISVRSMVNKLWFQKIHFFIMPQVSGSHPQPSSVVLSDDWTHLSSLPLADPTFSEPGRIDFLLSSGVYAEIKLGGFQRGLPGQPIAEETQLGWIVMGQTNPPQLNPTINSFLCECNVDFDLAQFWKQEEIPTSDTPTLTQEEEVVEVHFVKTHTRDSQGRYVVELPFDPHAPQLGNSENQCRIRYFHKEKSLSKSPSHKQLYSEQIHELLDRQYLKKVPPEELRLPVSSSFHLPHHGVFKESSSTTKLRIVLDASMKTSNGISLNDTLRAGPVIRPELASTLMKFRTNAVAFTADIEKMFYQAKVAEKHQNFLRLLWRDEPTQPIQIFKLGRVPFGSKPSSFLAVRSFQQLAIDEGSAFPLAAKVMLTDFYIDDCPSGGPDTQSAIQLQRDLRELSSRGGFRLTKFMSNDPEFMESIPPEDRATKTPISFEEAESNKTLGIRWNPNLDSLSFQTSLTLQENYTKRDVISIIARIFDPNGLLQPVIVPAKILIQKIWQSKIEWNDVIPPEIQSIWTKYLEDLPLIREIHIPRRLMGRIPIKFEIHSFADASKSAYGAAVYLRAQHQNGEFSAHLVAAKSRITPLPQLRSVETNPGKTIPRLELQGAVIACQLAHVVKKSLCLPIDRLYFWSDSSITLWRIKNPKLKNDQNVSAKLRTILEFSSPDDWFYIHTKENPADILSRGMSPDQLKSSSLWWCGPDWLSSPQLSVKRVPGAPEDVGLKPTIEIPTTTTNLTCLDIIPKTKTYPGFLRASVFIQRGIRAIQTRKSNPTQKPLITASPPLTPAELDKTELRWIKDVQLSVFGDEIHRLSSAKNVKSSSSILRLSPQLRNGILCVGGRIENSELPESSKHQIILPKDHPFTDMIIRHYHHKLLHTGAQQTRFALLEKFWIVHGHRQVKKVVSRCLQCFRHSAKPAQQLMGQLPEPRTSFSSVFSSTGLDYAGPLLLSTSTTRSTRNSPKRSQKVYVAVFVCMATKIIHLEPVTGLSTELFLDAFSRFTGIWGSPGRVYSDNGTKFRGANTELQLFQEFLESPQFQNNVSSKTAKDGIEWIFNPPSAPHQGGLWESAVKSFKHHLRRIAGRQIFSYEELATLLTRIQGVLNSRPLYPVTADQTGNYPLTPSHFYLGRSVRSLPNPELTDIQLNRLNRYQAHLQLFQHFQERFKREYLVQLQHRSKWHSPRPNIQIGQRCIVIVENQPSHKWSIGTVIEVHPGADGLVRKVTVETENGVYRRPIVKIIPIPQNP